MTQKTDLASSSPKTMLHFAPETVFVRKFKTLPGLDYLSADLGSPHAMVKMDITDIDRPDDSFDVIYCSHVLEHVPDDHKAMREMRRVLKPGGWALIQVPVSTEATIEDLTVTDPKERERLFGQWDHVRHYGLDIRDRLENAGFKVETVFANQHLTDEDREAMGVIPRSPLFVCTRPSTS